MRFAVYPDSLQNTNQSSQPSAFAETRRILRAHQPPVESTRNRNQLLEVATQALEDVSPDDSRHSLRRATWHVLETKRQVVLAQRQLQLHRRKWQALSVVAEACDHLIATLERLDAI